MLLLAACATQQKIEYEFPADMRPEVQKVFTDMCNKGRTLYGLHCARCHNYKEKRKEFIPDFKQEQLLGYKLRLSNQRHSDNLRDTLVSTDELGLIMNFLTYRKKNGRKAK